MKQLLQNLRIGETAVVEVPIPQPRPGMALVRTAASLVSAGTERTLISFAGKSLIAKARSRPDLVRQMLDKGRREGYLTAIKAAFKRLDQPTPLGYSSAGTVVAVGEGVSHFRVGDRVACAGGNYAVHAEFAAIPKNLLAHLPAAVDFDSGAFATLAAIALHGLRLGEPEVGEHVAIIGLGLLGLLSAGLAHAAGCQVFATDLDPRRVKLASVIGAQAVTREHAEATGNSITHGQGFDLVLICADTPSPDPVQLAGTLARDRARVVAVGAVGMQLPRKVYYEKELDFRVSRSYGPGRYDPQYEEDGHDYPLGYVRWTEGRNLQAAVDLMASGQLDVSPLISHRFPIEQAADAYQLVTGKRSEPYLGVLLTYPGGADDRATENGDVVQIHRSSPPVSGELSLGILGAGNYANAVFLPAVKRQGGIHLTGIASASGASARHAADRYGFDYATSSEEKILENERINVVAILTRHYQHAGQVIVALNAGKHVFCEKPLAITEDELQKVTGALQKPDGPILAVGFNRRFAPLSLRLKAFFEPRSEPMVAHYRVNAGYLPPSHWLHDPQQGGGRIIGEACHFIDFLTYLVGACPVSVTARGLPSNGRYQDDNVLITLNFPDGSLGTVSYLANGDKSFPKERLEAFSAGRAAALDDFRSLELAHAGQHETYRSRWRQDKGHQAGWAAFLLAVHAGGPPPIPYEEIIAVTRASFAAVQALKSGEKIEVGGTAFRYP